MARKSRKTRTAEIQAETASPCRAAIYVRLSVEDSHGTTVSIETQQLIIHRFLEQNPDITVCQTYIDNGATGTNFHRPGFQRMLSDIEAGLVNCVIVKDLSRLGRNAIDTGYYIEQYFRSHNIRFIAVNDNFDTSMPEDASAGIMIPLRNMINEAYALDIGRKIKTQQRQFMKDGKFIGGRTPYGYLKDPEDCHQLVIDPEAASVVRQIFQWASEGAGLNTIAVRLNEAGYQTPGVRKRELGLVNSERLIGNGCWQTLSVARILHSEVYTGDLVQGKSKTVDHKQIKAASDEYTVVRGTHEAIISHELFEDVQRKLAETKRKSREKTVIPYNQNLFKSRIYCSACGRHLNRQREERKSGPARYYFRCISRSRNRHDACPGVIIYEDSLLNALLDVLLESLDAALGRYVLTLEAPSQETERQAVLREKIAFRKREAVRIQGLVRSLYENLTLGILSKDEYFEYKKRYENQLAEASGEVERLEEELRSVDYRRKQYETLKEDAENVRENHALTAELVERLIERIEISPDRQITVWFRFQNEYAKMSTRFVRRGKNEKL